jgi:hypothetical protein
LREQGVFQGYVAYSYLVRARALGSHEAALQDWLERARDFAPTVIFAQHLNGSYPLTRAFLRELKDLPSRPKFVLYEEDPFGRLVKQLDSTIKTALAESDMAFLGGTGYLARDAIAAGCRRLRWAPHSYDSVRFGTSWTPTLTREFDAVMIGNLACLKRIPWLYMPGGAKRKKTARMLYRALGNRFAVFGAGQGWQGEPYCRGKIPFARQGAVIRNSWMSVNWGQFDRIAMYSSDRLPISMACGVPHITNYQPGYEHVFNGVPGVYFVKTPHDAVDAALHILSLTPVQRNDLGERAAAYAREHLEASVVYANIVAVIRAELFGLCDWRSTSKDCA